ncbi:12323_t:CDS:2 [Funneliformis geosporum]|uniref:Reticulon-like protein n=1 Tax=Funneliformis geosporum TaxID=1117311 RepID=A0A9W4SUY3_9GLOM|nr:12323_t:CDS:2 [Funneliformis geosporum]
MASISSVIPESIKETINMDTTQETSKEQQISANSEEQAPKETLRQTYVVNSNEKKTEASSKRITKSPFNTLTSRVKNLVYWENPTNSAIVLLAGLSFLIFTSYYSLFNTFCALAVTLIGANWAYVNGRKQLHSLLNQKPVNPNILAEKPWHIEREKVEKYLDFTIEAINFSLLEIQKIVLVDDPLRTIKVPLILGFAAPIGYQKNKKLVDEKLDHFNKILHTQMDRGLKVAKQHTGGIYEKARSYAGHLKKEE